MDFRSLTSLQRLEECNYDNSGLASAQFRTTLYSGNKRVQRQNGCGFVSTGSPYCFFLQILQSQAASCLHLCPRTLHHYYCSKEMTSIFIGPSLNHPHGPSEPQGVDDSSGANTRATNVFSQTDWLWLFDPILLQQDKRGYERSILNSWDFPMHFFGVVAPLLYISKGTQTAII